MTKRPETIAVCTCTVRRGEEAAFAKLVARHHPTKSKLGLTAKSPRSIHTGIDPKSGKTVFVEPFPWKDEQAPEKAHRMPEVMAICEPMGAAVMPWSSPTSRPSIPRMPAEPDPDRVDAVFAALAHVSRRQILLAPRFRGGARPQARSPSASPAPGRQPRGTSRC